MTTLLCGHVSYDLTKDSDWHSLVGVRDRLEMLDRRNLVSPSQPINRKTVNNNLVEALCISRLHDPMTYRHLRLIVPYLALYISREAKLCDVVEQHVANSAPQNSTIFATDEPGSYGVRISANESLTGQLSSALIIVINKLGMIGSGLQTMFTEGVRENRCVGNTRLDYWVDRPGDFLFLSSTCGFKLLGQPDHSSSADRRGAILAAAVCLMTTAKSYPQSAANPALAPPCQLIMIHQIVDETVSGVSWAGKLL
ncbi:uncharacterized protein BO96DRAFT_346514 [Aspergillus niger CBS 101883]|uniref:Uncharacterized protein n=3 Tax=Aspergillus niger TaxID=5061 RepID=A2QT00_ASPNC|nr:uncharacterized protein BO96DRAFT_346514 [Aspergillus niger CBS 101883]XP_059606677.1 hypothetical protein An09g00280 [Aspergillus niger]PYH52880.1 hypothetical protein BO96DRAFT_346514 [Aspergillus niger CBS 101883]RDH14937.1 hypothetical protein M747DRAFT_319091 [Aspergillus niger ATCC 13496]CAL00288.1 hypothetical protein An09g00280 [Aspergillus niger]